MTKLFSKNKNRGMALAQVIVIAAILTASISYITKLIHGQQKARAEFLSNLVATETAYSIQAQLTNPEVCVKTFETISLPITTPEKVSNITDLYDNGAVLGMGASKVRFEGVSLLPAPTNNIYKAIIHFIKIGNPSNNKPFGVRLRIKVTSDSSGIIKNCYASTLNEWILLLKKSAQLSATVLATNLY